ncbi:MAG: RICIN domain-containing protein, partial [Clostridia bacterium]
DSQVWALVTQGGGMYTITNKASGRSFDIPGGSIAEKASLTQYATNYGDNQIFELVEDADGSYLFKNKNSGMYVTADDGYLNQQARGRSNYQNFILTEVGECNEKIIGAAATLFLLKGGDTVSNAKLQWNSVNGATSYDVYRSVDGGEYKFFASLTGNTIDDYDLKVGSSYRYAVYALEGDSLIDCVETKAVEPYDLPADLTPSSNLEESSLVTPNTLSIDGVYYRYSAWGRDDGGSGFGRLMMSTSTDGVNYSDPVEVLNYKDILAHETCQGFESCRFESQNIKYNPVANKFVFIAHFEADGGYGTAMTSFASGTPGEYFTFHGAYRPEGDDTRDLNVYVDDDNRAYLMAAVHNNADLALYRLTENWDGIEKRLCYVNRGKWRELPSMLKVDGMYYLFTSGTAGWYPTQGMYNTASSIEGPWSPLKTVGNTSTFSAQSGYVSILKSGGENYLMNSYRWMYFWKDAVVKRTVQRRYPISVSNGYAFFDFYDELLYNWENDDVVPVQNGRILSQNKPAKASVTSEDAGMANDGNYQTAWYSKRERGEDEEVNLDWPFTWEVDLGKVCSLSELQISWLIWNGSEPYYQYKVEGSTDGVNYTTILDRTEGYTDYGFTVDELSGSARYVKITVVNARPRSSDENNYPAQLYEVKVLGK